MSQALQTVLAEMTLKDLASPNLAKIQKAVEADIAAMGKAEKKTQQLQKAFAGLKSGASTVVARTLGIEGNLGAQALNKKGQEMAGAIGSGSGFHQAISQIHFVGPYLAAALTAMHGSAQQYVAAVQISKEQLFARANFEAAYKKSMIKGTKLFSDTYFHLRDKQMALTGMRDIGVRKETVEKNADAIGKFTKAQGLGSLQEGMQALMSGSIKSGRGLTDIQIKLIQAYTPLLKDTMTADIGMRGIARVLDKGSSAIAENEKSITDVTNKIQKASVVVQDVTEETTRRGIESGASFAASHKVQRAEQMVQRKLGAGGAWAVSQVEKLVGGKIGKAVGGPVNQGQEYVVGEKGPEMFRPSTSGTIVPNNRMKSNSSRGGPVINNYFTINGGNPANVEKAVMAAINKAAATIWRQNTGLQMQG